MSTRLILFLIIFICISCQQKCGNGYKHINDRDDNYVFSDVEDIVYQILLKKWRKSADWQKQAPIDSVMQETYMCSSEVRGAVIKAVSEYYNIKTDRSTKINYIVRGEQNEHWRATFEKTRWDDRGDGFVWEHSRMRETILVHVLISRVNREILSTANFYIGKSTAQDNLQYQFFLYDLKLDCHKRSTYNKNMYEDIDSIVAANIAITTVTEHYGFKMIPIVTRSMGRNKEHWLAYYFPGEEGIDYTKIADYASKQREPDRKTSEIIPPNPNHACYLRALGVFKYDDLILGSPPPCPKIVIALISKSNGRVLSMKTYPISL